MRIVLCQQGLQAPPVQRLVSRHWDTREIGQGRPQVDGSGDLRHPPSRCDVSRPSDEHGDAQTALVERSLAPLHAAVPTPTVRAVVTEIDDDGVLPQAEPVDLRQYPADVPVDVLAHSQSGAGHRDLLAARVAVLQFRVKLREPFKKSFRDLHRRMRRVEWQVTEKRLLAAPAHELESVIGQVVGEVALAPDQRPVVVEFSIEILAPVAGREAIIFIKAAGVWVVGELAAVMPLAECTGGVAGLFECLGDGRLIQVHPLGSRRYAAHPAARMIPAGEELGACWCADGTGEEAIEQRSLATDRIDVWSGQIRVAVDAQIAPALVVGQDHDDIGPGSSRRSVQSGESTQSGASQQNSSCHVVGLAGHLCSPLIPGRLPRPTS